MKKDNERSSQVSQAARRTDRGKSITIGMDLGDKSSRYCVLEEDQVVKSSVATTKKGLRQTFGSMRRCRIALVVGTHSPGVSRLLHSLGHEAIVANPRQLRLITASSRKDDKVDAKTLGRPSHSI